MAVMLCALSRRPIPAPATMSERPSTTHPTVVKRCTPLAMAVLSNQSEPAPTTTTTKPPPHQAASRKCHCKRSQCLKLYCECFAANVLCDSSCKCTLCENTGFQTAERQKAMKHQLSRSKRAFAPKFAPAKALLGEPEFAHVRGCKCKRTSCQKKYCECFQAGVPCGAACKCVDCANDGSLPHLRNFGVDDWMVPGSHEPSGPVIGVESVMMILPRNDFGDVMKAWPDQAGNDDGGRKKRQKTFAPDRKFFHNKPPSWNHCAEIIGRESVPNNSGSLLPNNWMQMAHQAIRGPVREAVP
eukprot:TRINITY_DN5122_c0_g1_i3.p2 TRINITY_DN5122_c0_g1~~TRINITY_DN5122_c0_g1_i3.p2  ORF type:complete len:299 (-),score=65.69 TRINITY_DN5122_c0_g1_i3:417-1313(-)